MFGIWHRTSSYPTLDSVAPKELRDLHKAWAQACGPSGIPLTRNMPVHAIQPVLPHMALIDLGERMSEPRYMVFGPALRALLGRDPTGLLIRHVYPDAIVEEIMAALGRVRRERIPLFYRRDFRILRRDFGYTRLMLPLCDLSDRISHVAVGIYPVQQDLRHASQWQAAVEAVRRDPATMASEWRNALAAQVKLCPEPQSEHGVWMV